MHQVQSNTLVNAASVEYAQVVDFHKLGAKVYTPKFLEKKNGNTKIIQFYAKKARGLLTKYIVLNNIRNGEDIRGFNYHGYLWNKAISTPHQPVFIRVH